MAEGTKLAGGGKSPPRPGGRKAFVRTRVPWIERAISLVILFLLAAIAGAVWFAGKTADPDRYKVRIGTLQSTASAVEGKAGTARSEEAPAVGATIAPAAKEPAAETRPPVAGDGYGEAETPAPNAAAGAAPTKKEPLDPAVAGLKPTGDTEFYGADNLYEKIDGRAPAYLTFNFEQLRARSFAVDGGSSFVDLYDYRMDTPVNAFGIFALERDPKGAGIDFAADGYAGEMGIFFRRGNHYVQVIASDQKPRTMELARALAIAVAGSIPEDDKGLEARRKLPADGLDPASVTFVQENAQGQAFLKNAYQANYASGGGTLAFFLMVTTPEEAGKAWDAYLAFSGRYGGKAEKLPDVGGARLFQAESFGTWRVIYQRGGELGGVVDAKDGVAARQFVEEMLTGKIR